MQTKASKRGRTDDKATECSSEATVRSSSDEDENAKGRQNKRRKTDPEDNKVESSEVIGKKLPVLPFKPKPKEPESCIIS